MKINGLRILVGGVICFGMLISFGQEGNNTVNQTVPVVKAAGNQAPQSAASTDPLIRFNIPSGIQEPNSVTQEDISVDDTRFENHAVLTAYGDVVVLSQLNAKIIALPAQVGDTVKKNQVLLKFNCVQPQADYKKAKAEYLKNKVAWQSAKTLEKYKAISHVDFAKAQADYLESESDIAKTGDEVKKCFIMAPFDGKVVDVVVHEDEVVKPGDKLMQLVRNGDIYVRLFVPSTWLSWLKVGIPFTMNIKESQKKIKVIVDKISGKIHTGSQSIEVHGKINGSTEGLVAGMSGIAQFKG